MAESRVACLDQKRGQEGTIIEDVGVVVGQLRRWLSVAAIRATYTCLLSRLNLMGAESKKAAERRKWRQRRNYFGRVVSFESKKRVVSRKGE